MSVNVYVAGQRDSDGKLAQMADLLVRCNTLDVEPPAEVAAYFSDIELHGCPTVEKLIDAATEVSLHYDDLTIEGLLEGDVEYGDGLVIDLTKLPEDIKRLRVYMS